MDSSTVPGMAGDAGPEPGHRVAGSKRVLLAVGAAVVALAAVATVLVVTQKPATFAEGTPERTVQQYLVAVLESRPEDAQAFLSDDLQRRCRERDLSHQYGYGPDTEVTLRATRLVGDTARIDVDLTVTYRDGLMGIDEYTHPETFVLARLDGEWRISEVPWPLYWCPEEG